MRRRNLIDAIMHERDPLRLRALFYEWEETRTLADGRKRWKGTGADKGKYRTQKSKPGTSNRSKGHDPDRRRALTARILQLVESPQSVTDEGLDTLKMELQALSREQLAAVRRELNIRRGGRRKGEEIDTIAGHVGSKRGQPGEAKKPTPADKTRAMLEALSSRPDGLYQVGGAHGKLVQVKGGKAQVINAIPADVQIEAEVKKRQGQRETPKPQPGKQDLGTIAGKAERKRDLPQRRVSEPTQVTPKKPTTATEAFEQFKAAVDHAGPRGLVSGKSRTAFVKNHVRPLLEGMDSEGQDRFYALAKAELSRRQTNGHVDLVGDIFQELLSHTKKAAAPKKQAEPKDHEAAKKQKKTPMRTLVNRLAKEKGRANTMLVTSLENGVFTDGRFIVRLNDKERADMERHAAEAGVKTGGHFRGLDIRPHLGKPYSRTPAKVIGTVQKPSFEATAFEADEKRVEVQTRYLEEIQARFPKATAHRSKDGSLLMFEDGGEVVGVIAVLG